MATETPKTDQRNDAAMTQYADQTTSGRLQVAERMRTDMVWYDRHVYVMTDVHDVAYSRLRERFLSSLHTLVQVSFHVLEHKKELVVFSNDLFQLDNIRVIQFLQRLHI